MNTNYYYFNFLKSLIIFIGFLFFSASLLSQKISGRVYDDTSVVPGVTVFNANQKTAVVTNEDGAFSIKAETGDSITFQSAFHESQTKKITLEDYSRITVIELKRKVNILAEVLLSSNEKEFDLEEYNTDFNNQIQKDRENNPLDYAMVSSGGINIKNIIILVASIFKKKPEKEIIYATQTDLINLFKEDKFFNQNVLENTLKIPKQYKTLFLDYCAAKQIEESLLKEENKFQLLDIFVVSSNEFRDIIAKYEVDK